MTGFGTTLKNKLLANQWSFLLIVVAILSIVAGGVNPRYWWLGNITNLLGQISVLSLVSCGATILIVSGNFDISVGANIGLSSVVMAILMKQSTSGIFSRHKCRSEKVDLFRPERHLCWSRGNAFALEGRRGSAKHRDGNRVASDRFSRDRRCPYDGWQRKYSWNILRRFALGGDWKRFEYDAR